MGFNHDEPKMIDIFEFTTDKKEYFEAYLFWKELAVNLKEKNLQLEKDNETMKKYSIACCDVVAQLKEEIKQLEFDNEKLKYIAFAVENLERAKEIKKVIEYAKDLKESEMISNNKSYQKENKTPQGPFKSSIMLNEKDLSEEIENDEFILKNRTPISGESRKIIGELPTNKPLNIENQVVNITIEDWLRD